NLKLADNAIGYTHASGNLGRSAFTSRVVDSLFVGETANVGNPTTPAEKAYGRSLPEPALADFPIRGYEFYDYRHELDNVTFVNFQDNATRKTGAISYLLYTSFSTSNNNKTCQIKPTWNAAVCTGDVGRLTIDGGISNRPGGPRNRDRNAKPKAPVTLSRNGKAVTLGGMESNIRAGTEITVTTERPSVDL